MTFKFLSVFYRWKQKNNFILVKLYLSHLKILLSGFLDKLQLAATNIEIPD